MVKVYQTYDMEDALQRMAETNRNVLVYMRYRAHRPIRLRLNLLPDLRVELCKIWKPFAQQTIERWQRAGGVMVFRPLGVSNRDVTPTCDAMLIIEAPFSINEFERITKDVRQEVVVYRPPTWELHNEALDAHYPKASTYITLDAIFKSLVGRELTEEMQGALAASGYPESTTAVFTADDITALTGWNERFLRAAIRNRYRFASKRWHVYTVRIRPDGDEALAWAYDILMQQPEVGRGQRAMHIDKPPGAYVPGFKTQMKRLARQSYISKEDCIYIINLDGPPLQIDRLDAINNMYLGRWFKVRNLIDESPEY